MTSTKTRRRLIIGVSSLAALAVLVVGGTFLYINVLSDDPLDPLGLESPEPSERGTGTAEPTAAETAGLDGTWTIVAGSEAGYRVDEVLNGQDNTVVGRTNDVSGEITVTDGSATAGEVTVDMTTITTDSGSRDGQFGGPIMQTDEFPTSTFTLTEPIVLDQLGTSGRIGLSASGELTVRDVTQAVDVQLDLQMSGTDVQVAGSIPIAFADFEVDPPNLGFVRVEDEGIVEFLLTLRQG